MTRATRVGNGSALTRALVTASCALTACVVLLGSEPNEKTAGGGA